MRVSQAFPEVAFTRDCPTRDVLDRVMAKWAPLLIAALSDGDPLRWSELRRRAEGISEKMLAQTLRALEQDGLVLREARPVVPPYVEYSLTPLGADLAAQLVPMLLWITDHAEAIVAGRPARGRRPTG